MSFIPISSARGRNREPTERVHLYVPPNAKVVIFRMTRMVMNKLGWVTGDRIVVSLGIEDDLGRAMLTKVDHGRHGQKLLGHRGTHTVHVTVPHLVGGIPRDQVLAGLPRSTFCEHAIANGQLTVELPRPRIAVRAVTAA